MICCCSFAGTKACENCRNRNMNPDIFTTGYIDDIFWSNTPVYKTTVTDNGIFSKEEEVKSGEDIQIYDWVKWEGFGSLPN